MRRSRRLLSARSRERTLRLSPLRFLTLPPERPFITPPTAAHRLPLRRCTAERSRSAAPRRLRLSPLLLASTPVRWPAVLTPSRLRRPCPASVPLQALTARDSQ